LDQLGKAANGDEEINNLPTSDALIDGGALDVITENGKAAAEIIKQMIKDGKIDEATADGISDAVLEKLDIIADKDKNDQEIEAAGIASDELTKVLDNLLALANLDPLPSSCAEAFADFLNSLNEKDLANATLAASVNDPDLAADINNTNALANTNLSTEEMKKFLLLAADNENDKVSAAVTNSSVKADALSDEQAKSLVDSLTKETQSEDIEKELKSELTALEKMDNIANGPEKPTMPEEAKTDTADVINSMDDEHIIATFNLASADPDFANFLNDLLSDELQDIKDSAAASPSDADAANTLGLSPEEMRKALKNGNDMFLAFASGDTKYAGGLMDDSQAKSSLNAVAAVADLLTNDGDKQNLATISNSPNSDQEKVTKIAENDSFSEANKDKLTGNIDDVVMNQFSDEQVTKL